MHLHKLSWLVGGNVCNAAMLQCCNAGSSLYSWAFCSDDIILQTTPPTQASADGKAARPALHHKAEQSQGLFR